MKVFISYAREDYASAKKLFDYLKQLNDIEPWLDKESLLPGMDWKHEIMVALRESRFVVLLLSPCLINKSGYVRHEIKETLERLSTFPPESIFLIPARLEECMPKDEELLRLNWVDMFPNWDEGIKKIKMAIQYERNKESGKEKEAIKIVANSIEQNTSINFSRLTKSNVQEILSSTKNFVGANLMNLNLNGCDFTSADLQGANLVGTILTNCNFSNANLKAANLERAELDNACLINANLWGVNFWRANLRDINGLEKAILQHTNFYGVRGMGLENLPSLQEDSTVILGDYGSFIYYFRETVGMSPSKLRNTFLWLNHEYFVSILSRDF